MECVHQCFVLLQSHKFNYKPTTLLSKDFLANFLEPFGHLLLPNGRPDKDVRQGPYIAKIQALRLNTKLKASGFEAT